MIADLATLLTRFFEASLAVGLLVAFVLIARGPVARRFGPRAAYALWILPLLRLAMPPIPLVVPPEIPTLTRLAAVEETAPIEVAPKRDISPIIGVTPALAERGGSKANPQPETVASTRTSTSKNLPPVGSTTPEPKYVVPAPIVPVSEPASDVGPKFVTNEKITPVKASTLSPAQAESASTFRLPSIDFSAISGPIWRSLALIWAFVTLGFAIKLLARQFFFADRIWQQTIEADPQTVSETRQLAEELGVRLPIAIRLSPGQQGPLVCGLFRPIIVVPENFSSHFDATQRRYALAHELLHVRRGDLLAILFMTFVRASQWFNPLAGRAVNAFRSDQEAACDASVLRAIKGQRHDYAQTLLKAVRMPSDCGPVPALTLDHGLKERLKLMNIRQTLRGGAIVVSGLAVLGLVSTASYAVQEEDAPTIDELERLLDGGQSDEKSKERPTLRNDKDSRRAELVRERVISVRSRLGSVRDDEGAEVEFAALARDSSEAARRAEAAKREEKAAYKERQAELKERQRDAKERQRDAKERSKERQLELAEHRREAEEVARELRREAAERSRELAEESRERAEDAREWAADFRSEMADLRADLAEEARDIAEEVQHEIHLGTHFGTSGHALFIGDDSSGHQLLTLSSEDVSVTIDANDGIVLLTDPMAGLEDRMAALENFSPDIPEIPEPPQSPEVVVVEVKTADGRTIKLPSETTIVLPTLVKDMEEYSRHVEAIMAEADIDGQVKAALGEDFDKKVHANTAQISKLTKKCELRKEDNKTKPMIMSSTKNGVTQKILCFCPDEMDLNSSELSKFVSARNDLTSKEKKRFKDARQGNSFAFSITRDE